MSAETVKPSVAGNEVIMSAVASSVRLAGLAAPAKPTDVTEIVRRVREGRAMKQGRVHGAATFPNRAVPGDCSDRQRLVRQMDTAAQAATS
jgi:hypothetical protein